MSADKFETNLPSYASVVVIGGGVMGCSTLYHLAKNGVSDAILLERNELTSGTTWHSAAQVRALRSTKNLTDLIRYSVELYAKLEKESYETFYKGIPGITPQNTYGKQAMTKVIGAFEKKNIQQYKSSRL